jgi:hypothetical protein
VVRAGPATLPGRARTAGNFMRTAIAVVVLLMLCAGVRAQTLTECGKSDGYAYYFPGGLVPADKGGWKKDGIDGGRIILNYINGEIDLLIKNATGSTVSVRQDGGKIFSRQTNNGLIALTIIYEAGAVTEDCMSSEHFGQLAWQFKRVSGSSGLKVQAAIAC